jgi:SH3 domain-containing YSC84-like protein 1
VGGLIGAELSDYVFILNSDAAVRAFTHKGNLALGANASFALGTSGRALEMDACM